MNKVNPEINTDTEAQDTAAQETEAYYATNHAQVADTENFTSHTNEGFDDIPQSPPVYTEQPISHEKAQSYERTQIIQKAYSNVRRGDNVVRVYPNFEKNMFHEFGVLVVCPYCDVKRIGWRTIATATCLVMFGCWAGCFLIPFFNGDCKDIEHTCSNCDELIIFKRMNCWDVHGDGNMQAKTGKTRKENELVNDVEGYRYYPREE